MADRNGTAEILPQQVLSLNASHSHRNPSAHQRNRLLSPESPMRNDRYNAMLFKTGLLDCEFVDMPVLAGAGGFDARPMEPVFSFASLASQVTCRGTCNSLSSLIPSGSLMHHTWPLSGRER